MVRFLTARSVAAQCSSMGILLASRFSGAAEYTIEDRRLEGLPGVVSYQIETRESYSSYSLLHCDVVGVKILELSGGDYETYFVTTSNSCGWGAGIDQFGW